MSDKTKQDQELYHLLEQTHFVPRADFQSDLKARLRARVEAGAVDIEPIEEKKSLLRRMLSFPMVDDTASGSDRRLPLSTATSLAFAAMLAMVLLGGVLIDFESFFDNPNELANIPVFQAQATPESITPACPGDEATEKRLKIVNQNYPLSEGNTPITTTTVAELVPLRTLKGTGSWIDMLSFYPLDSSVLLVSNIDQNVVLWCLEEETEHQATEIEYFKDIVFTRDGRQIVSAFDKGLSIYDFPAADATPLRFTNEDWGDAVVSAASFNSAPAINMVVISRNGKKPDSHHVTLYDMDSQEVIYDIEEDKYITTLDISPNGRYLVIGFENGSIRFLEITGVRDGVEPQDFGSQYAHSKWVKEVLFSPDGRYILSTSEKGVIKLWDARDFTLHAQINDDVNKTIEDMVFSPDGSLLFMAYSDDIVTVWDVETGTLLRTLRITQTDEFVIPRVKKLDISADGTRLAVGVSDGTVWFWGIPSR